MRGKVLLVLAVLGLLLAGCLTEPSGSEEASLASASTDGDEAWNPVVRTLYEDVEASLGTGESVRVPAYNVSDATGSGSLGSPLTVELVLENSSVLTDRTWAEVGTQEAEIGFVRAYEGHLAGEPDEPARLTLTREWARGLVFASEGDVTGGGNEAEDRGRAYVVRVGTHGNLPHPGNPRDGPLQAQSPGPRAGDGGWPTDDVRGSESCPLADTHQPRLLATTDADALDPIAYRVIFDADAATWQRLGEGTFTTMVAIAQEVDGLYEHAAGLRLELAGLHVHPPDDDLDAETTTEHLRALETYWNERPNVTREGVHLVIGEDNPLAIANCTGAAGFPEAAYSVAPLTWTRFGPLQHVNTVAHEIGHLLSAEHHYGNHVESHLATIMIQGYTPGERPMFSTLSSGYMRAWAEEHLEDPGAGGGIVGGEAPEDAVGQESG